MTATNHAVTGALIGAYLPWPVAIPLAFASHFMMDALPHFGIYVKNKRHINKYLYLLIVADTLLTIALALTMIYLQEWGMVFASYAAYSPDSQWVYYYLRYGKKKLIRPQNWFAKFHKGLQKHESPLGIIVEAVVLLPLLPILYIQLFG